MLETDKIDYKSAGKAPTLEVPPDLTQLSRDTRYSTGTGGSVTASSFQGAQPVAGGATAPAALGDARIERAGMQRWLVVNRPADQLWGPVRDFWQENGFLLTIDQAPLGIMETDWAENRSKLPQDFVRATIGKFLDSVYSTGERDRFRTRLERTANGATEVYISHRGMIEVYANATKDQTVWQPRAVDPELEAEFLRRLMVKLSGATADQARMQTTGAGPAPNVSQVAMVNNQPVLQVAEPFDRAWRRVGLTLDRTGFTVEDRDRNEGVYFVRYVTPDPAKKEPGFLGKLFSSSASATPPVKYRVAVRRNGENASTVTVLNAAGAPESSVTAQRIVQVIADDLK